MKRNLSLTTFLLLLLLVQFVTSAQNTGRPNYKQMHYLLKVEPKVKDIKVWNEVPPVVLPNGDGYTYISSIFFSTVWRHQQNLATPIDDVIKIDRRNKGFYATASMHWWGKFYNPKDLTNPNYKYHRAWKSHHWRRNYNGIFSAHILPNRSNGNILFAISHGENKNERIDNYYYQNTVRPNYKIKPRDPSTYSGGTPYKDSWNAYFGFLNGKWAKLNSDSTLKPGFFKDIGPILWPSAGYVTKSGEQASQGLRNPSSIVYNGYLYIFVTDTSMDGTGGVKLARVREQDVLSPHLYQTWATDQWVAALPKGFSPARIGDYFSVRGPANTSIVLLDKNIIRFSVAKYKDEPDSFIAVEEYINSDNSLEVAFRYSDDLIHWSDRQLVIYRANSWHDSELRYPVFMNTKGLTDGSIQPDEFYVIGSRHDGNLSKLYFQAVDEDENGANQDGTGNGGLCTVLLHKELKKESPQENHSVFFKTSAMSVFILSLPKIL